MREVFLATVRARGLRAGALVRSLALLGLGAVLLLTGGGFALPVLCGLYALMVTNGLIGEDVRDGSVGLLLSRPLTRTGYLAGRLAGAGALTGAYTLALMTVMGLVHRPGLQDLVAMAASALTAGLWTVAVIFLFSTFLPGRADAVAALALWLSAGTLYTARTQVERPALERALEWAWDNVTSTVSIVTLEPTPANVTDLLRWSCNLLLVLLAGVVIFNRRQFGYAD